MQTNKTQKRLVAAINTMSQLKVHLERTLEKVPRGSEDSEKISELVMWLGQQAHLWRHRRDAESKSSEAYRFFDGKSEGFEAVLRFIAEQSGEPARSSGGKGYMSAHDTNVDDNMSEQTATMSLYDTRTDRNMA